MGLLVILDGGKGLRTAVQKAFRDRALVQTIMLPEDAHVTHCGPRVPARQAPVPVLPPETGQIPVPWHRPSGQIAHALLRSPRGRDTVSKRGVTLVRALPDTSPEINGPDAVWERQAD